jgi:hypothetical protein
MKAYKSLGLARSRMTTANISSTTVYMKSVDQPAEMNSVYWKYFGNAPPAIAAV